MRRRLDSSERKKRAERYLQQARDCYIGTPGKSGFVGSNLSKALVNARRALLLNPNSYETLLLLGKIIEERSDSQEGLRSAIDHYDRAIALDPYAAEAYGSKSAALFDAEQYRLALAPAIKTWRLTLKDQDAEPFDIEVATVYLRDTLAKLRKWNLACEVVRCALDRVPRSDWLQRLLELTQNRIEWAPPDERPATKTLRRVK